MLVFFGALLQGCNEFDYYSIVKDSCGYRSEFQWVTKEQYRLPLLRKECRERLLEIIPFDSASFAYADPLIQEKILEALQILVGYNFKAPPENRVFGVAPFSLSPSQLRIFNKDEVDLGAYFNFILNGFDVLKFDPVESPSWIARFTFNGRERVLTVNPRVLSLNTGIAGNGDEIYFTGQFAIAALLSHEIRHSEGYLHQLCPESGNLECDEDLSATHGFEIAFYESLLHGSGQKNMDVLDGPIYLSATEIRVIGNLMCKKLKGHYFQILPGAVADLLQSVKCSTLQADTVIEWEHLERN